MDIVPTNCDSAALVLFADDETGRAAEIDATTASRTARALSVMRRRFGGSLNRLRILYLFQQTSTRAVPVVGGGAQGRSALQWT
jgi:hypothetical protein